MSGSVGFYGKLPGTGDFVRRRLASAFVDEWDRHFQCAVQAGRSELGEAWTAAWRRAAAWRFVLPANVCGNDAWCGLVGPAADRLGRVFPMVLAARCAGDVASVLCNDAWFNALECVYRSARSESVSVEAFEARVAALPGPLNQATGLADLWATLAWDSGQWQLSLSEGEAVAPMLAETWTQLRLRPGPWCMWWTHAGANLLATRGLPRSYASLLVPSSVIPGVASQTVRAPAGGAGYGVDVPMQPSDEADASVVRAWRANAGQFAHAADDRRETPPGSLGPATAAVMDNAVADEAMLSLDNHHVLVLSADDGPYDARRIAARRVRQTAFASIPDFSCLRAALMALHTCLSTRTDRGQAVEENGAAMIARFDGLSVRLLRIGAAAAWHWRRGQLQPLFVEHSAGAGGEFDDLLFGEAWLHMPGIGTAGGLDWEETAIRLEHGDRLLMLVTRELVQLPRSCFAAALELPACDDARAHLAACAGLRTLPAQWPLAVIGVGA